MHEHFTLVTHMSRHLETVIRTTQMLQEHFTPVTYVAQNLPSYDYNHTDVVTEPTELSSINPLR
jgi:hypothetical protein